MADLMASNQQAGGPFILKRGDSIAGTIVSITQSELIIDFGAKAEGVINKKDLTPDQLSELKVGSSLESFVAVPENDSGQVILTPFRAIGRLLGIKGNRAKKWQKFIIAQQKHSSLNGKVVDINRGGILVDVAGLRGFLPASHIGFNLISDGKQLQDLIGENILVNVIEVDLENNRLIFSSLKKPNAKVKESLRKIEIGQKVSGKIVSVVPFGLIVNVNELEAAVENREISWYESSTSNFETGQEIGAVVIGKDELLGKLSLSIRQTTEDPFESLSQKYQIDDVVEGSIRQVMDRNGVLIDLEDGLTGFLPQSKIEHGTVYQVGQAINFLIDSIDEKKRHINLAPFLTSTKGLIYK